MHRDLGDPPGNRDHPHHPGRRDDPPPEAALAVSDALGCALLDIDENRRTVVVAATDMVSMLRDRTVDLSGVHAAQRLVLYAELATMADGLWIVEAVIAESAWWGSTEAPPWSTP